MFLFSLNWFSFILFERGRERVQFIRALFGAPLASKLVRKHIPTRTGTVERLGRQGLMTRQRKGGREGKGKGWMGEDKVCVLYLNTRGFSIKGETELKKTYYEGIHKNFALIRSCLL